MDKLPCDVLVQPHTLIKAGCLVNTLMHCIEMRRKTRDEGEALPAIISLTQADEIKSLRQRVERLEGENERLRSEAVAMWRGGVSNTVAVADRVRNRFAKGLRLKKNQRLAQFDAELDAALGDWFDKTRAARPASYNESEDLFRAALSPKVQEGE